MGNFQNQFCAITGGAQLNEAYFLQVCHRNLLVYFFAKASQPLEHNLHCIFEQGKAIPTKTDEFLETFQGGGVICLSKNCNAHFPLYSGCIWPRTDDKTHKCQCVPRNQSTKIVKKGWEGGEGQGPLSLKKSLFRTRGRWSRGLNFWQNFSFCILGHFYHYLFSCPGNFISTLGHSRIFEGRAIQDTFRQCWIVYRS